MKMNLTIFSSTVDQLCVHVHVQVRVYVRVRVRTVLKYPVRLPLD
jgi:hypothetical protein